MPYIKNDARGRLAAGYPPSNPGELNYAITVLCDKYLWEKGKNYDNFNAVVGVLESAKLEIYRRLVAPYETEKCETNGDVFT